MDTFGLVVLVHSFPIFLFYVNFYTCKCCLKAKNRSIVVDRAAFDDFIQQKFVGKTKDGRGIMHAKSKASVWWSGKLHVPVVMHIWHNASFIKSDVDGCCL